MKFKRGEESLFMPEVRRLAEANNWLYYHTADSRRSPPGYPDVTLARGDTVILAELKSKKGRVTKDQRRWISTLKGCSNIECYLWRPDDMGYIRRRLVEGPILPHM